MGHMILLLVVFDWCILNYSQECLISNGILNRAISEAAGKAGNAARYLNGLSGVDDNGGGQANAQALSFLYPYGATLNVARPAVPVLSTGSVSFPLNRPVCAFYSHPGSGGKLAVLGSGAMFADQYIGKKKFLASLFLTELHTY